MYHFVLWWQSRREVVLLVFALHCALCSVFSADILALVTARTPQEGQQALDLRGTLGLLGEVTEVWLLSLIAGVRARWFVWFTTAGFLAAAVANVAILPLTGTVTAVERISTAWGEEISILRRDSPSVWLGPIYAVSLSVGIFAFICVARLWSSGDRIGSVLVAIANTAGSVMAVWAFRIDASGAQQPYFGAIVYAPWVLLFAIQIARDRRLRGSALEASREQLQSLTAGLLPAREEERTTIAREIHDVFGQTLTALKMDVEWMGARLRDDALPLQTKIAAMSALIDDTVVAVRRLATDLRPGVLDDLGLRAEAQRLCDEQPRSLDLLFTDVVMPGMNGRALADLLRARFPGLKVIYTSGYMTETMESGTLDPSTPFVGKPFTARVLASKVREVLDGDGA